MKDVPAEDRIRASLREIAEATRQVRKELQAMVRTPDGSSKPAPQTRVIARAARKKR